MQTSRERTLRAIEFRGPDKIPICLDFNRKHALDKEYARIVTERFPQDMVSVGHYDPDFRHAPDEPDEWGCVWSSMGHTMGEVIVHPLDSWDKFDRWAKALPDFSDPKRYIKVHEARRKYPDHFLVGGIGMMMEDIINFRGFEEYMTDLYLEREKLDELIDLLYKKADEVIHRYAEAGVDGIIAWEDWGLQDRPLMRPALWQEIFKERMAKMIKTIHDCGMKYMLHSCGYILDFIDDFVEIGVDVLQMDQQRNMGLDALKEKVNGRMCLWCPTDVQFISRNKDIDQVLAYDREMVSKLSSAKGGFMYKVYGSPEAIEVPLETLLAEVEFFSNCPPGLE